MSDTATYIQHQGIVMQAEGYMDTVSQIRGSHGRPPLPEENRIYFMKKRIVISKEGRLNTQTPMQFDFILEATEKGEQLLDAYVGVEFSIIVKYSRYLK